ncbi:MAG: general secretion pathway protein GspB [Candidatus Ratteibacteria bacterium]|nr:general secretion pathway protein GspB [Candidatus Ratteibacteria bacterium]
MKKRYIYPVVFFLLSFSAPAGEAIPSGAGGEETSESAGGFDENYQDYILEIEKYRDPFVPLLGGKSYDEVSIKQKMKLEGILWSPINPLVVINGETLELGDEIDGAIIERIDKDRVVLRYNKKTFSLVFWE